MRAEIIDPQGFTHVIEYRASAWYGFENIAHGWEPKHRAAVIDAVLTRLLQNEANRMVLVTLPYGFTYAT